MCHERAHEVNLNIQKQPHHICVKAQFIYAGCGSIAGKKKTIFVWQLCLEQGTDSKQAVPGELHLSPEWQSG